MRSDGLAFYIHPPNYKSHSWEQRKVGELLIERNEQAPMNEEYPLMAFIANEGVAPKVTVKSPGGWTPMG